MAKKQKPHRKVMAEFLFWLHTLIIVLGLVSGLFISFWWVVAILVGLRLQQILFHGCLLTTFEVKARGIKRGQFYYQLLFKRLLNINLSRMGVRVAFTTQVLATLFVAWFANAYNIRFHI